MYRYLIQLMTFQQFSCMGYSDQHVQTFIVESKSFLCHGFNPFSKTHFQQQLLHEELSNTTWKLSKYGVFSGPYLETFHTVTYTANKSRILHNLLRRSSTVIVFFTLPNSPSISISIFLIDFFVEYLLAFFNKNLLWNEFSF